MTPRRAALIAFFVVLAAGQLAVGMRASRTASVTGDEPFYLLTSQSLLSDGDLDLRDEYHDPVQQRHFWDGTVPLWKQMKPTEDGRLLSPHDPGLSLLTLPAYAVGGVRGVQRFLVVVWSLAMALSVLLAARFGAPPWAALVGGVAIGAGTPGIVYASQVYPEGPAALAVAAGLLAATDEKPRPVLLLASVLALPWLGSKYIALAVLIAGAFAWRHRHAHARQRLLGALAGVAVLAGAHYVWWHFRTFDGLTPYATNIVYSGEGSAQIVGSHLSQGGRAYRLYGLFLDARFGLFRWSPIALLAVVGLNWRPRTRTRTRPRTRAQSALGAGARGAQGLLGAPTPVYRFLRAQKARRAQAAALAPAPVARQNALAASVVAIAVLIGTFVSITMMGWWFPGRMLIAAFPGLVVLVAAGAARVPKPVTAALAAWSLAIAAATAWAAHHRVIRLAVDPFDLGAPLAPAWLFPDFRTFGTRQVVLSLAWGTALVAARSIALRGNAHAPRRQLPRLPRLLRPAD